MLIKNQQQHILDNYMIDAFDTGSVEPRTVSVLLKDSSNSIQLPSFIVFLFAQIGFDKRPIDISTRYCQLISINFNSFAP